MVGAYMLASYGINVSWDGNNWKEESLPMLVAYNAGPGNLNNPRMVDYVRRNYAEAVWTHAEKFRAPAIWPTPGYTRITDGYGMRVHPVWGTQRFHAGIDIGAPMGARVVSVSGGIAYPGYDSGYGNMVTIKDGTYEYIYAHLSEINVTYGQMVTPGQQIGKVGSTGVSTGPHLHFEVRPLDSGLPIDPLLVVSP